MKPIKEGKVREIYDNGDSLIMVATDRISCFDVILKNIVSKKGTVLTQMSKFWFDLTKDILPNHMISTDVKDMPEFFQKPEYDGNSMMCKKLEMLPIECIVRGYITGSGWKSYQENGTVCGIKLPEGLKESDKLYYISIHRPKTVHNYCPMHSHQLKDTEYSDFKKWKGRASGRLRCRTYFLKIFHHIIYNSSTSHRYKTYRCIDQCTCNRYHKRYLKCKCNRCQKHNKCHLRCQSDIKYIHDQ